MSRLINFLFFSSGDLLSWDLNTGKWKAILNGHGRVVFTLCKDSLTNYFVSTSMDRMVDRKFPVFLCNACPSPCVIIVKAYRSYGGVKMLNK